MTQKQKIIIALLQQPRANYFFITELRILQYNARIKELRDAGFDIPPPRQVSEGTFEYTLKTPETCIDLKNCRIYAR